MDGQQHGLLRLWRIARHAFNHSIDDFARRFNLAR
jgi:hypothetical protein